MTSAAPPLFVCYAEKSSLIAYLYQGLFPGIGQFSKKGCSLLSEKIVAEIATNS